MVRDAAQDVIQEDEDFVPGASFPHSMRSDFANSDCTMAVLSPECSDSDYCLAALMAGVASVADE